MRKGKNISVWFRRLTLACLLALVWLPGKAQQDPVYSQYMNNLMSMNPAYTGVRDVGSASLISRKQWMGAGDTPFTTALSLSLPLDSMRIAGGFDFLFDNIGPATTTALFLDYSYRIKATYNTKISFGLKAGFNYLHANLLELDRYHQDDRLILDYGDISAFLPNFGVGVFWYGDDFYAGFSVPRLLQSDLHKDNAEIAAANHEQRHYFIHGAYLYKLSPSLIFKPGLSTILTAGAPVTADFDFSFLLYDQFWVGAMYRISDAAGGYVQMQIQNLKVGISYDYSHTRYGQTTNGTFEVMLRYDFKTKDTQLMPFLGF